MRILLLGEFSSLHKYLKDGLLELGHDVSLFANGDGWKKIDGADSSLYNINNASNNVSKFIECIIKPLFDTKRYFDYEVIQIMTPTLFHWIINPLVLKRIIGHAEKFSLCAAGSDYYTYKSWKNGDFRYDIYDDNTAAQSLYSENNLRSKRTIQSYELATSHADVIIPSIPFQYSKPYAEFSSLCDPIPFPINLSNIEYRDNVFDNKIVLFHGINRPIDKGSNYIIAALKRLQAAYPEKVECIINERMPFDEYLRVMKRTNIIVDQCKGYGYGINACLAMGQGKIVLSGAEPEILNCEEAKKCPIINILPDEDDIYNKLEDIVLDYSRTEIQEKGYQGRLFVETYHDYIRRANDYVKAWQS